VDVKEGDYILAVNHRPFARELPFEASFENLAGKPVMLTVNSRPTREGARNVVVKPWRISASCSTPTGCGATGSMWRRRPAARSATSTSRHGHARLVQFDRWFYAQLDKEGMVIDARWNGAAGSHSSSWRAWSARS